MTDQELTARPDFGPIEARWQAEWKRRGYAHGPETPHGPTYSIILPPPNVTGVLHFGHIMGDTIQDLLIRYHRMQGRATTWVAGLDHAGLATQVEVRRRLAKQGVELERLPREEILAHVEGWRREHEARIREQEEAAGFSLDWERFRYTLDAAAIRTTREVFVKLYREGLIYRGERIVNWDPQLETAVSDLEVVHSEENATLFFVRYPWADGSEGGIIVATVRPETIFGDVAVAVHPDDSRYAGCIGRSVIVPLTSRAVPIITDAAVDPEFGLGALKITPRHDLVDYEIFRRHDGLRLPPSVLDSRGRLEGDWVPPEYRGMDREVARSRVIEALTQKGLVEKSEAYRHSVGRSERSDAVIEPRLSTQWFVRMAPLAGPAVDAVRTGSVRIFPERWNLTFFRWMENLQDWCISRQIVWGHPIPVYYCDQCHSEIASVEVPTQCARCEGTSLTSDPDVLDTWFTSWLWPFHALGWPEATADLAHYYPNSVLVTGREIMFFWVARMIMAGFYFTGKKPFSAVYFTGLVRDEQGRKMSKHLGNSPDPLTMIRQHGADPIRFALLFPNPTDQDGPFGTSTIESARNFLTKLWNIARFTLSQLPAGTPAPDRLPSLETSARLENRWILSRYAKTVADVDSALSTYEFTRASQLLYQFVWHDLADRYVEVAKEGLRGKRGEAVARETREVLLFVVERTLRLLHPWVPHVTEELWHALPHTGDALMVAPWPSAGEAPLDAEAEVAMEVLGESVRILRNLRAENRISAESLAPAWVRPAGTVEAQLMESERETIVRLARVERLELIGAGAPAPTGAASRVAHQGEFFLGLPPAREEDRRALEREQEKLLELLAKSQARLADRGFLDRAPAAVVTETREKVRELTERLALIEDHLSRPLASGTTP
ncbi:MAG: valine--tRNA ligase [Thermoplasmata archaeon]